MFCCRSNCTFLAVILGVLAGFLLGILYAFEFVSTGILFWVYLVLGAFGILLAPLYAIGTAAREGERCFCYYKTLLLVGAVGTIVSSAVGLLTASLAPVAFVATVVGVATFFLTAFLSTVACLADCICRS